MVHVLEGEFYYGCNEKDPERPDRCQGGVAAGGRRYVGGFEIDRTEAAQNTVWVTGCNSWYLDDRGVPAAWPWKFERFRERMTTPEFADFELR